LGDTAVAWREGPGPLQDVGDNTEGGGRRRFGAQAKEVARTVQSTSGHGVFPGMGPRASTGVQDDRHGWCDEGRERGEAAFEGLWKVGEVHGFMGSWVHGDRVM